MKQVIGEKERSVRPPKRFFIAGEHSLRSASDEFTIRRAQTNVRIRSRGCPHWSRDRPGSEMYPFPSVLGGKNRIAQDLDRENGTPAVLGYHACLVPVPAGDAR